MLPLQSFHRTANQKRESERDVHTSQSKHICIMQITLNFLTFFTDIPRDVASRTISRSPKIHLCTGTRF